MLMPEADAWWPVSFCLSMPNMLKGCGPLQSEAHAAQRPNKNKRAWGTPQVSNCVLGRLSLGRLLHGKPTGKKSIPLVRGTFLVLVRPRFCTIGRRSAVYMISTTVPLRKCWCISMQWDLWIYVCGSRTWVENLSVSIEIATRPKNKHPMKAFYHWSQFLE